MRCDLSGDRSRLWTIAPIVVVLAIAAALAPPASGASDQTLHAGDVGLGVLAKPHASTVIAIDQVTADCSPGPQTERKATVATFAQDSSDPANGAQLNQIVYDFPSAAAAKTFFAHIRSAEHRRAHCGATEKATNVKFVGSPKGIGDARFTVTADEKISGVTRKVAAVHLLAGSSITELIFIDWGHGLAARTTIAKRAVTRLG